MSIITRDVTLDHLRRGHRAIALAVQLRTVGEAEAEVYHDTSHRQSGGYGGYPAHSHAEMSGFCELESLHDECVMIECVCPCHGEAL